MVLNNILINNSIEDYFMSSGKCPTCGQHKNLYRCVKCGSITCSQGHCPSNKGGGWCPVCKGALKPI